MNRIRGKNQEVFINLLFYLLLRSDKNFSHIWVALQPVGFAWRICMNDFEVIVNSLMPIVAVFIFFFV